MWEQVFADDTSVARPGRAVPRNFRSEEPETTPPAATGGYYMGGGYGGGYGGYYAGAPAGAEEAQYFDVTVDTNESATTIYRYGYDGSIRTYNVTPPESEESEEEAP